MRLLPSDPDVETIISRIEASDLNLQPDFQRGEVWSKVKKQRLIDSILRDWHVPPVHVIELSGSRRQEVLDGQQRLVAIRDFYRNEFAIDGGIEPLDDRIQALDGQKYRDLSDDDRRQFNQFTIRFFRIVDYKSSEPAELFFRLNQPTNLTAAEQRNAFFGIVRQQIKALVESLEGLGLDKAFLGFSNSRMAYDDVLCRVALTVQRNSIAEKISSADLVEMYRSDNELSSQTLDSLKDAFGLLATAKNKGTRYPRFNKATLYSWFIFLIRARTQGRQSFEADFPDFLEYFVDVKLLAGLHESSEVDGVEGRVIESLLSVYDDRSTSRVADVSSVVVRDCVIWFFYGLFRASRGSDRRKETPAAILYVLSALRETDGDELARALIDAEWGRLS